MKNMKYLLFVVFTLLFIPNVKANSINSIDVKMHIDEYGNAKVTEVWDMYIDEGTEVYKPLGDMENTELSNFKVSLDGKEFTYLDYWNINDSFENKAYKNGISSSNELCFGQSKRGNNVYTITYDLTNVIYNVDDAQFLYWKFINDNMNPAPKNISITIDSFYSYPETLDVWGYGYKGYAYVKDGVISASNEDQFNSSMYSVLLVKYPTGTYNTTNKVEYYNTFDEIYNMAENNTFDYDYDSDNNGFNFFSIVFAIFPFFMFFLVFAIGIKASLSGSLARYKRGNIDQKDINNFRDIPCNKNIFLAYFLSCVYGMNKKKEDFLGALLLKWLKDNQITIKETNIKHLFGKDEIATVFDFSKPLVTDNSLEQDMYDMLVSASKDNILEPKELEKWCKNHYGQYLNWFDKVNTNEVTICKENGTITRDETLKKEVCSLSLHEEAIHLAGLKKYLVEFSRISEKQPIEVKLWNEYLMYAQIFGIAKEVAKQFKDLYPEIYNNSEYNSFDYSTFIFINSISTTSYTAASSARSAAQSYSSGGGGFSSGGGGGGSFGGGSGGGCR